MLSRYFCKGDGIFWSLFSDEYTGFSESTDLLLDIACVLGAVCQIFIKTFDLATIKAHPVLSVVPCVDDPITFRKNGLIFLSSRGRYYNQHIYQFAHELCHFMVTDNPVVEYRWLDETLAHMMSWYAMNAIYDTRNTRNIVQLSPLYETMPGYINDDMKQRDDLCGEPVAVYIQRNLEYLRENFEDRYKNRAIAYEIYPLFREHPELWKIVPFLDQLTPDMTLESALQVLCSLANIPSCVLDLLTKRLC